MTTSNDIILLFFFLSFFFKAFHDFIPNDQLLRFLFKRTACRTTGEHELTLALKGKGQTEESFFWHGDVRRLRRARRPDGGAPPRGRDNSVLDPDRSPWVTPSLRGGGGGGGLQALGQNPVRRGGRFGRRLGDEAGAQLHLQPLHLVVVQVLLHQVALALDPRLHVRRDVGDHPRHEELDHEHHVLQENHLR